MVKSTQDWDAMVVDSIVDYAICRLDPKGFITHWNAGAKKIKKYAAQEIIGHHYSCFFPHDAQLAGAPAKALQIAADKGTFATEAWRIRKDGARFWANITINAIRDEKGALLGFVKITRDCTAEKEAETTLIQNERNFRLLVQGVVDYAIYMLDRDGRVASWNAGAERAKGYKADEIIGRHFSCFYPPEAQAASEPAAALETALREGKFEAEGWRIRKDGTRLWAGVVIDPVCDENGELIGFAKITRDITEKKADQDRLTALLEEQKKITAELKVAVKQAEQASRAKSAFLANMSHEIRTPMNGVLGMTELLVESDLNERQRLFADNISKSGNALLSVINDILDFSKIESDKLELDPAPFDLRSAVEDVAALLGPSAQAKGLELGVRCDPAVPPSLIGDAGRIRQVVTNLVGNAIKFTEKGHIFINVDAAKGKKKSPPRWRIEITDTGIGVDSSKLDSIFEAFSQVQETSTRAYGGTGLGLAITRNLAEMMGGETGATSEPGKGSSFWVELPLDVDKNPAAKKNLLTNLPEAKILLVDDVEINLDILEEHCKTWELKPTRARSGKEAIDLLEKALAAGEGFDAILLDYHMPGMDGLAVAEYIHTHEKLSLANIVVLSSADNDASIAAFRAVGAEQYLVKPVRASRLHESLSRALCKESPEDIKKAKKAVRPAAKPKRRTRKDGKKCILLADDVELNRIVVQTFLDGAEYDITFAENGKQAVQRFTENDFDVVLMDISMPVMDGFEATAAIRAFENENGRERTPIICLTAHALKGQAEKCIDGDMDDFITKPVKKAILMDTLSKWTDTSTKRKKAG